MATIAEVSARRPRPMPGRRYDRVFFSAMVLLILVTVVAGFGPTYYLAGVFPVPLPSRIIQVHAVVFSAWIVLLAVQTGLVSAHRVALHRTLGLAGFCLAPLVVVCGLLAMASQLRFRAGRGADMLTFSAVSLAGMCLFGVLAAGAYATRKSDLAAHKRLILMATLGLLDAAIHRLHLPIFHHQIEHAFLAVDFLLVLLVAYDLFSLHRIHRATLWGSIYFVLVQQLALPLGATPAWHAVARWIQCLNV